jgi:hypothetical protein
MWVFAPHARAVELGDEHADSPIVALTPIRKIASLLGMHCKDVLSRLEIGDA